MIFSWLIEPTLWQVPQKWVNHVGVLWLRWKDLEEIAERFSVSAKAKRNNHVKEICIK